MQISGNLFIKQFLHLLTRLKPAENITEQYMEKVLHAVFFFGRLNRRQMTPDDFLEPSFSQRLQQKYPQSFQQYSTHLPSLTPYSILLQFVSTPHLHGANHGAGVGQVRDKCSTL